MVNLDLLRALAVLCVFCAHLVNTLGFKDSGSLGRFGVVLFFVHTSFVLMCSLRRLDNPAESETHLRLLAVFFIRRFFRIYPLAAISILLTVILHIPIEPFADWRWLGAKALLVNLALLQNLTYSDSVLSVLWSLPLEVEMYVMLPFAYLFLKRYSSIALWIFSVLVALAAHKISGRLSVFLFAPCFASGILAFDLIDRFEGKLPGWVFLPALLFITLLFGPFDNVPLALPGKLPLAWGLSLLLGILIAACNDGAWRNVHPVAHWIAERSYGVYLVHVPLFWLALDVMRSSPTLLKVLVVALGSVGLPTLLYRFIEKPLITVGHRIAEQIHQPSGRH